MRSRPGMWLVMSLQPTQTADCHPRILMVRMGAMGDAIHTIPAAADLRRRFPNAHIAWAIETRWAPLLRGNPYIDETVVVPLKRWRSAKLNVRNWREAARLTTCLRTAGFDLAIDFQGLLKSATIAALSGAKRVAGFHRAVLREPAAELLYTKRVASSATHVVERYRDLAALDSVRPPTGEASFWLPQGSFAKRLPERFVLASPQAGWGSKQWPKEHYSALAARIWEGHGIPLVADCAPGQAAYAHEIAVGAPSGAVIPHASTIAELIATTRRATAVVGVDSGPLHMAAALGKRGVAIFGPTDPARNGPYCNGIVVVRARNAETTYKRTSGCSRSMRACGPEQVYDRLGPLLN